VSIPADLPDPTPPNVMLLPEARRLRRALESLGVTAHAGNVNARYGVPNADAAQLAGALKAVVERIENGLRGAELQTQFQKGWFGGHDQDTAKILAQYAAHLDDLAQFAGQGIRKLPLASVQFTTAALAALTGSHAMNAAALIALADATENPENELELLDIAQQWAEEMIRQARELTDYVAAKQAQFGEVTGRARINLGD
jgi:hypothetical protein